MAPIPFWMQQRGLKTHEVNARTLHVSGESMPDCEVSVFPLPTGPGWVVSVDQVTDEGRRTIARTESPFENESAAWQAGFDLLRQRLQS
jgi:hypothetical protein